MKWSLRSVLAAVLATSGLAAVSPPSFAACDLNPVDGPGLAAAVTCLNADPAGGTITLKPGVIYSITAPLAPTVPMTIVGASTLPMIAGAGTHTLITMSSQPLSIRSVTLAYGSGSNGGAIANQAGGDLTLTSVGSATNKATGNGGFLAMTGGKLTITGSSGAGTAGGSGGFVYYQAGPSGGGDVSITNSYIYGAQAKGGPGGALAIDGAASATLTGVMFTQNSTAGTANPGGAVWVKGGLEASDLILGENTATGQGGGIFIENLGKTVTIDRAVFDRNVATVGGGLRLGSSGQATITNTTFYRNNATGAGSGGGALALDATATIAASTFYQNTAAGTGSTFFINAAAGKPIALQGSIVSGSGNTCLVGALTTFTTSNVMTDDGCLAARGGTASTTDLQFVLDSGTGQPALVYSPSAKSRALPLRWSSPAVRYPGFDASAGCPAKDFAGTARPGSDGTNCTLGAAEYKASLTQPALTTTGARDAQQSAKVTSTATQVKLLTDTGAWASGDGQSLTVGGKGRFQVVAGTPLTITFDPAPGYVGVASAPFVVANDANKAAWSTYTATTVAPPASQTLTSSGMSPTAQSVSAVLAAGETVALLDAGQVDADNSVSLTNKGTFVLDPQTGKVTFTPEQWFAGDASVVVRVTDAYGQFADSTYTATVTAPAGPQASALTSTGVGTAAQNVTVVVTANDDVALLQGGTTPADSVTDAAKGTFVVNPTTGVITFTPVLGFAGDAVVSYRITDGYGQTSDSTYTATVSKPAAPSAPAVTISSGASGTVSVPSGGNVALLDAAQTAGNTVTVSGQGTFTLDPATGVITFAPVAGFAGEASVPVRVTDAYGQAVVGAFKISVKASASPSPTTTATATPTPTASASVKPSPTPTATATATPVPTPTLTPALGWAKPASSGLPHVAAKGKSGAYLGVVGERWRFSLKSGASKRPVVYKVVVTADAGTLSALRKLSLERSDKVRVSGKRIIMSLRTTGGRDAVEFFTAAEAMKLTVRVTRNGKPVSGSFVRLGSGFEPAGANPVTVVRATR